LISVRYGDLLASRRSFFLSIIVILQ
jgi:hypothetical protein